MALINRELSWLSFARRVLALAEDPEQPLLERVKFAGIMGSIYDEFAMKRIGGLLRKAEKGNRKRGPEGLTPAEELKACRAELRSQQELVATLVEEQLRPALCDLGTPILDIGDLDSSQRDFLARYFADSYKAPRSWAERAYPKLTYFNEVDRGCQFAVWQEPALFAGELRAAFRSLR